MHTTGSRSRRGVDLQTIARPTAGLTGADLANIANEAAIAAGRRHPTRLDAEDFDSAMERVVAGLQQRRVVSEKEKRILAYHEAGHALVCRSDGRRAARPQGDDRVARPTSVTPSTCRPRTATSTRRRS